MKYINHFIYSNTPFIRILRHVLFWVTDIVNWWIVVSVNTAIEKDLYIFLLCIPWVIVTTYFIIYYLLPKFTTGNNKSKLFIWLFTLLVCLGFGLRVLKFYILFPVFAPEKLAGFDLFSLAYTIKEVFSWLAVISMAIAIKLLKNKSELQEKNEQLLNEKKEAELGFLKAQMQPHFLFNTLNTLYSETIQESGKAQVLVLHLSSLLRFILDECNKPLIPICHELRVIKDYIALEQLRHGSRLLVDLQFTDIDKEATISPLLFLPFIENSFKHSLNNNRGINSINITISTGRDEIILSVINDIKADTAYPGVTGKQEKTNHYDKKGMVNTKRQLDLIYGKHYSLTVTNQDNKYRVLLKIPKQVKHHV